MDFSFENVSNIEIKQKHRNAHSTLTLFSFNRIFPHEKKTHASHQRPQNEKTEKKRAHILEINYYKMSEWYETHIKRMKENEEIKKK